MPRDRSVSVAMAAKSRPDGAASAKARTRRRAALAAKFGEAQSVKIVWKPQTMAPVDQERAESLMKLVEALDEDDDVQNVFSNADISDDVMARLNAA